MKTKLGTELHPSDREHVLAAYVHRYTGDFKPKWVKDGKWNGGEYPLQFVDDADWLANTEFRVKSNGRLDERCHACMSYATWPNNPELRLKYPSHLQKA